MRIYLIIFIIIHPFQNWVAATGPWIDSIIVKDKKISILDDQPIYLPTEANEIEIFLSHAITNKITHYFLQGSDPAPKHLHYPYIRYTTVPEGISTLSLGNYNQGKYNIETVLQLNKPSKSDGSFWITIAMCIYGAILLASIIFFFTLYNLRKKLQEERIRNSIASDLHDEVGSNLSSIAMFTKVLDRSITDKSPNVEEILGKIKHSSEVSIINLRDTVWSINPENDRMTDVFQKLKTFAEELFHEKEILIDFRILNGIVDEVNGLKLDMEQRRNLYLIIKEALHNILKHAKAQHVEVCLQKIKNTLKITITDDGIGISENRKSGIGLQTMKNRAEKSGFTYTLSSDSNGTRITIESENI